jgi:hypothetical protein
MKLLGERHGKTLFGALFPASATDSNARISRAVRFLLFRDRAIAPYIGEKKTKQP